MKTTMIDASLLECMLRSGLGSILSREAEINKLNVFPVADGDTGTNMRLTIENGVNYASGSTIGAYLKSLSNGMLLGARGNSGVILSQIFKGIYQALSDADTIGVADLFAGLESGYKMAYSTVVNPVEGTILTVTREGVENIRSRVDGVDCVEDLLSMYLDELQNSLARTPDLLDVLKSAGVIDSGAMGYCVIIDGMLKYLNGESSVDISTTVTPASAPAVNLDCFDENSSFDDGYCMEFLLQLMADDAYDQHFVLDDFITSLKGYGESIVAIQDDKRVKVHIHTKKPALIITYCQQYGEFLTFKLENMQLQHNEHIDIVANDASSQPRKPLSIVCVADGDGLKDLFGDLGCDVVIDGGATMNPPAYDFVNAFDSINADNIVVLPNNKNAILAAQQAVSLYTGDANIVVIPTHSMIDAYYAIAMDVADHDDVDFRISQMQNGIANNHTLAIAPATKGYSFTGGEISCGDTIAMINGEIVVASGNMIDTIIDGIRLLPDIDEKEVCMIVRGDGTTDDQESELCDAVEDAFPDLEPSIIYGGQHVYSWLIGLI